jgi:hypothetical protein
VWTTAVILGAMQAKTNTAANTLFQHYIPTQVLPLLANWKPSTHSQRNVPGWLLHMAWEPQISGVSLHSSMSTKWAHSNQFNLTQSNSKQLYLSRGQFCCTRFMFTASHITSHNNTYIISLHICNTWFNVIICVICSLCSNILYITVY